MNKHLRNLLLNDDLYPVLSISDGQNQNNEKYQIETDGNRFKKGEIIKFKKGTLFYRCSKNPKLYSLECNDTGKCGLYFSTNMLIALAMCIEKNNDLFFLICKLKNDINVHYGKYYFRNLNSDKNISHFDNTMLPIIDRRYENYLSKFKYDEEIEEMEGELFLSEKDLQNIEIIKTYQTKLKGLSDLLYDNNYAKNSDNYYKNLTFLY